MKAESIPFVSSALFGLMAWAAVTRRYIWPRLRRLELRDAAEPILYLHLFRYIGLAFIAPGAVSTSLSPAWAYPAAYGDLAAALLAGVALISGRGVPFRAMLWIFGLWGTFDLLRAAIAGPLYEVQGQLQATFFIPVLVVPLLLWTHAAVFGLLLRRTALARAQTP